MPIRNDNMLLFNIGGFIFSVNFSTNVNKSVQEKLIEAYLSKYLAGFLIENTSKKIDFRFNIIWKEKYESMLNIAKKKLYIAIYEEKNKSTFNIYNHVSTIQLNIIFRTALQKLLANNCGFIIHASCVIVNGKANLFVGKSGAGKSTSMKILSKSFQAFADDSVLVRKIKGRYYVFAAPYPEKNAFFYKSSDSFILGKIFFLKKSKDLYVRQIFDVKKIIEEVSEQFFTLEEYKKIQQKNFLEFINIFNQFYELEFNLHTDNEMINLMKQT